MSSNDVRPFFLIPFCLALGWPLSSWSADTTLTCPSSLETKSTATAPAGWQLIDPSRPHPVERVGFYAGHPSEMASLVPDKTQVKKGEAQDAWAFPGPVPEGAWMACFYTGTSMSLAQRLAPEITRCEVRYRTTRNNTRLGLIDIQCQTGTPAKR